MKQSSITVTKGEKWASLSLSLVPDLDAGKCALINEAFIVDVKCLLDAHETREPKVWEIAILSGAPYAFRLMNTPHKEIIVHYLKGLLDEDDIEGVSIAAAIAIVDVMGVDPRKIPTGEWRHVAP